MPRGGRGAFHICGVQETARMRLRRSQVKLLPSMIAACFAGTSGTG
jgi:hypothetical protein